MDTDSPKDVNTITPPPFPPFSVSKVLHSSQLLLASSGKEFNKPLESAQDVAAARKEAMTRLGLDFFVDVEEDDGIAKDLEKEFADDDRHQDDQGDVKMGLGGSGTGHVKIEQHHDIEGSATPGGGATAEGSSGSAASRTTPIPALVKMELEVPSMDIKMDNSSASPPEDAAPSPAGAGKELSKREMNRLKRKRKDGNAFVGAISSSAAAAKAASMENPPAPK